MTNPAPAGLAGRKPETKRQNLDSITHATDVHPLPRTPIKNKRIATAIIERSLIRFEAERHGCHCLNSTVSTLRNKFGIAIDGKRETVPSYQSIPTSVVRYSISPENLEAALKIIERMR